VSTQSASIDVAAVTQAAYAALSKGDAAQARELLDRVVAAQRADASVWMALAHARGMLGDDAGQGAAIDRALSLEPNDLRALLAKGDYMSAAGDARGASAFYAAALQSMPRYKSLPAHLQEGLKRAQAANQNLVRELEDFVRGKLDDAGVGAGAPARFRNAVDILFGKKRAYVQEPRYLYYPELPQIQFYERSAFPWLDGVEAATAEIRKELQAAIGGDFKPYVTQAAGRPRHSQAGLVGNPDWSAYFLYKDGAEQPGARQCPRTLAALEAAPLTRIPKRTPSILFSKLAAGARIPPHTGMLNARLICHLPLIVPAGCEFRVGNNVRAWSEGQAWVFDDTIEHEAWNRSSQDRYILIFDIWRPELSEEERAAVTALCEAIDAYRGDTPWDA
jgi:aspartyl/asparaginyl beta-hydroxylase (cupin superfamily)